MKPGDMVAWDYRGIRQSGVLRRLGVHLAHVQVGDDVRAVALADCQLELVAAADKALPAYHPELAYGIGEDSDRQQAPGRAFDHGGNRIRRRYAKTSTPQDTGTPDAASIVPAAVAATTTPGARVTAAHQFKKPRKPHQSEQSERVCVDCGSRFTGRTTQTRCRACFAKKRKADGRAYYAARGKQMRDHRLGVTPKRKEAETMEQEQAVPAKPEPVKEWPCRGCGAPISGHRAKKWCEECAKERHREKNLEYYRKHGAGARAERLDAKFRAKLAMAEPAGDKHPAGHLERLREDAQSLGEVSGAVSRAAVALAGELGRMLALKGGGQ